MLISAARSCLLIVDVQEKLVPAVHEHEKLIENCAWLMNAAAQFDVPVLMSEQYPRGLGPTVPVLRNLLAKGAIVEKVHFSCGASPECRSRIDAVDRSQVIVAGVEAHVCVLQTSLDLLALGKEVFLVADAVSSRDPRNAELAMQRMGRAGVEIVCREMVFFEWAHRAGTAQFRELSARFLK